ncbi:MAG: hypothetical protein M3Z75_18965 [Actinomycetota bacterium]|nr:hypothetical protein [Actinomycetota bacterium]
MTDEQRWARDLVARSTAELHASPDLFSRVVSARRRRRAAAVVGAAVTVAAVGSAVIITTAVARPSPPVARSSPAQVATAPKAGSCPSSPARPGRRGPGPGPGGNLLPSGPAAVLICSYAGSRAPGQLAGQAMATGAPLTGILTALAAPLRGGVRHCGPPPRQYRMVTLRFEYSDAAPFTVLLQLNGCEQASNGRVAGWFEPPGPQAVIMAELSALAGSGEAPGPPGTPGPSGH